MTEGDLNPEPAISTVSQRRRLCGTLLAFTIPLGLVWRLVPLHLPQFAFKYGGSALWAAALYWATAALLPRAMRSRVAILTVLVATSVELFKLVIWSPLDHFRDTLAGKLLLGRYFTLGALLAYWLAIGLCAFLDRRFLRARTWAAGQAAPSEGTV